MITANGVVSADREATIPTSTGEEATAIVMKDSPCVLSLGKRCMLEGYSFEWNAGESPVLVSPDGKRRRLELQNMVPVLPATVEGETSDRSDPVVEDVTEERADREASPHSTEASASSPPPVIARATVGYDHNLTHFPKLSTCEICAKAKTQKAQCRRKHKERREKAGEAEGQEAAELGKLEKFGELLTADHAIIGSEHEASRQGQRAALIILDAGTRWIDCYPSATKSAADTLQALQNFVGPQEKVNRFYTDNSGELIAAAKTLGWRHDTSTPNRPQTNGMAESAVRKVLEGTRAVLMQSGLPHRWWAEASRCYCFLRNVCDDVGVRMTAYQRRHQ